MSAQAQLQLRQNVEEMREAVQGLGSWEADIKAKDAALRKKRGKDYIAPAKNIPPIRGSSSQSEANASNTPISVPKSSEPPSSTKSVAIKPKTYMEYRQWDKFDVDKALQDSDDENDIATQPPPTKNEATYIPTKPNRTSEPKKATYIPTKPEPPRRLTIEEIVEDEDSPQNTPAPQPASQEQRVSKSNSQSDLAPLPSASSKQEHPPEESHAPMSPSEDISKLAMAEKDKGNDSLKKGDFEGAIQCYSKSLSLNSNNAIVYSNRAFAQLKLNRHTEAENDASRSIAIDQKYVKSYYRRGQARAALGKHSLAAEDYQVVLDLEPTNKEAQEALRACRTVLVEKERMEVDKATIPLKRKKMTVKEVDNDDDDNDAPQVTVPVPAPAGKPTPSISSAKKMTIKEVDSSPQAISSTPATTPTPTPTTTTAKPAAPTPTPTTTTTTTAKKMSIREVDSSTSEGTGPVKPPSSSSSTAGKKMAIKEVDGSAEDNSVSKTGPVTSSAKPKKMAIKEVDSGMDKDSISTTGAVTASAAVKPKKMAIKEVDNGMEEDSASTATKQPPQQQQQPSQPAPSTSSSSSSSSQSPHPSTPSPSQPTPAPPRPSSHTPSLPSTTTLPPSSTTTAPPPPSAKAPAPRRGMAASVPALGTIKPSVPTAPPHTASEFERAWKALRNDIDAQGQYLKIIPPASFPNVLKEFLDADLLTSISNVLLKCFVPDDCPTTLSILDSLSQLSRFNMCVMFFSKGDKKAFGSLFDTLKQSLPSEAQATIDSVRKKYGC